MRTLLALPCCCSCLQATATELKKQKPLVGVRGGVGLAPFPDPFPRTPPHTQPPRTSHGCGVVSMVSWGPHHSKAVLESEQCVWRQAAGGCTFPSSLPKVGTAYVSPLQLLYPVPPVPALP